MTTLPFGNRGIQEEAINGADNDYAEHNDNDNDGSDNDNYNHNNEEDRENNYMAEKKRKVPKASLCRAKSSILGTIESSSRENTWIIIILGSLMMVII